MTIAYVTSPYSAAPTFNKAKFKPHDRQRTRIMKVTCSTNLNAIAAANQAVNVAYIPSECIVLGGQMEITTQSDNVDGKISLAFDDKTLVASGDPNVAAVLSFPNSGRLCNAGNVSIVGNAALTNCVVSNIYIAYVELDAQVANN
jgi:hypothetical protein